MSDVLDDLAADPGVRASRVRDAVINAIERTAAENDGEFDIGRARKHLPVWANGPQVGATITALVRSKRVYWTGEWAPMLNGRTRNALRGCKVYRVATNQLGGN